MDCPDRPSGNLLNIEIGKAGILLKVSYMRGSSLSEDGSAE